MILRHLPQDKSDLSLIIFKLRKNIHSTVASVEETKDAQKGLQESQQQLENGTISLDSKVADKLLDEGTALAKYNELKAA